MLVVAPRCSAWLERHGAVLGHHIPVLLVAAPTTLAHAHISPG